MDKILETESQKYFSNPKKDEEDKLKNNHLEVEYKGEKFDLYGFKAIKEGNEILFAWKIRFIDKNNAMFLFYKPPVRSLLNPYIQEFIEDMEEKGFEMRDMEEEFDKALSQKNSLKKSMELENGN